MSQVAVRAMGPGELARVLDWAAAEGWNPGHQDHACFDAFDPGGLLVTTVGDEPVGSLTAVNYDEAFAFLGLYIVHPEWRGQGHGWRLWQAGMDRAGSRVVGLDGVVAQQANYQRSGFRFAHRNLRFAGRLSGVVDSGLINLEREHLDAIERLDRRVFPASRRSFWDRWLTAPGHLALGAVEDGTLGGFGVLRPCRTGAKIGPVVAPDRAVAGRLIDGLVGRWGGGEVYLDVPELNADATALASERGMTPMFETARMYTGAAPDLDLASVFGITTFELG